MEEHDHENERLARIQRRLGKQDLSSRQYLRDNILCSYVGDADVALQGVMLLVSEWCITKKEIDLLFLGAADSQSADTLDQQIFWINEALAESQRVFGRNSPALVRWLRNQNENLSGLSPLEHLRVYPGDLGRVVDTLTKHCESQNA